VIQPRAASAATRAAFAAVLAILMALRLVNPAGFMPAFDHGAVTIVACPDFQPSAARMMHEHHRGSKKVQQHCPYAAGAASATAAELVIPIDRVLPRSTALLNSASESTAPHRFWNQPPATGPPSRA